MNNYTCENAQIFKNGIFQGIKCKALNGYCCCMRYCPTKKMVELTELSQICLKNPNRKENKE